MNKPSSVETPRATAPAHYDRLLAGVYAWMLGDRAAALEMGRKQLRAAGIGAASPGARALDLGAGLGVHAIPLAELGYQVTALDTSPALLAELRASRPEISTIGVDLLSAGEVTSGLFDVVICMGDTLPHLASLDDVRAALAMAATLLAPGGRFVCTFRDYVSRERRGAERFLLVRADDARVMTCCLDFDPTHVTVTDILHERGDSGWAMRASEYRKVRLAREWAQEQLTALGLALEQVEEPPGWVMIAASKGAE